MPARTRASPTTRWSPRTPTCASTPASRSPRRAASRFGTLCVFDDRARDVSDFDTEVLAELAAMVEAEIASLSLAIGDELTGLSNRRGFEMLGERLVSTARRLELPVTAIYADLDNLKPINDNHGHEAGDAALIEAAGVLTGSMRPRPDRPARRRRVRCATHR